MHHPTPQRHAILFCLCGVLLLGQNSSLWLDVPFIEQEKDGCGAAVIAMVMQYWALQQSMPAGDAADPAAIQHALLDATAHGIRASDMERYFRQHKFRVFTFAGDWSALKQHLEKGRPLIVALKPLPGESALHYVVVAGLDDDQKLVLINDPAQKKLLKEERASFEKEWNAVHRWTLLAVPE